MISDSLALSSKRDRQDGGPPAPPLLPQSCLRRRAAAPAGAARADRHLLMQLHGCGPHDPVEPLALSLAAVAVAVARRR